MWPRKKERRSVEETEAGRKEASACGKERGGGSVGTVRVKRLTYVDLSVGPGLPV